MGRVSLKLINSDLAGRVGGLRITGYGQYGKPTTGGRRERYLAMVSYKSKMVTLAAEYASIKDTTTGNGGTVTAVTSRTGSVLSAFGVLNVPNSRAAILGRVDITDPNTASASTSDRLTRIIAGVSYQLTPNFRLMGDVDNVSRQGGIYNNAFDATRTAASLVGQFTF
jgi:predicted porin